MHAHMANKLATAHLAFSLASLMLHPCYFASPSFLVHGSKKAHSACAAVWNNCRPTPLEVTSACYSAGNLLLSEATGGNGRTTKLLLSGRNHTLPLAALNAGTGGGGPLGLREMLTELDNFVPGRLGGVGSEASAELCCVYPGACKKHCEMADGGLQGVKLCLNAGEACAIAACPHPGVLGPEVHCPGAQDELVAQMFLPACRYVLISTAGVVELEKRRYVCRGQRKLHCMGLNVMYSTNTAGTQWGNQGLSGCCFALVVHLGMHLLEGGSEHGHLVPE